MKNLVIILFGAGLLFLPVTNSRGSLTLNTGKHENDLERFMNVEKWRGKIKISINETRSFQDVGSEDYYILKVNHQYGHNFITGEGEMNVTDPFYDQENQDGEENEDFEDYDEEEMEEMDMAAIQNFMKDFDPDDIEGSLNKMNIGFDSYKVWTLFGMQGVEMGESNSDYLILDQYISYNVYSGEGCAGCCPVTKKELFEANGKERNGTFHLSVNIKDGIYGFVTSFGGNDYKLEHSVNYNRESCPGTGDVFKDEINQVPGPYPYFITSMPGKPEMKNQPLPAEGLTLAGSATLEGFGFARNPLDGSKIAMDATISWVFVPADQEIPEVILSTEDKDWIPEEGNTIEVKVTWQEVVPSEVEFTLFDISEEPGICLNSQDDNTEPDMVILQEDQQVAFDISKKDGSVIALTKKPSSGSEILVIKVQDYGAHARIRARIKVNGAWYDAEVQDPKGMDLHLPFDENSNHIADQWEKDVGIFENDYSADWDEDPYPEFQLTNGDGFTLYEEYRGFMANEHQLFNADNVKKDGNYFRMDPNYKDVFIYDEDNLFKDHYASDNPSFLNWHYVDPEIMRFKTDPTDPEHRWINFNTTEAHFFRKQYAMHLQKFDNPGQQGIARNLATVYINNDILNDTFTFQGSDCQDENPKHPLRCRYLIQVSFWGIQNFISQQNPSNRDILLPKLMASTVQHEVGHGLGIGEHFNIKTGAWEKNKSEYTGTLNCVMRYDNFEDIMHPTVVAMDRYCKKGETWTEIDVKSANDPNYEGPINTTTYPSHDCFGKINIKGF